MCRPTLSIPFFARSDYIWPSPIETIDQAREDIPLWQGSRPFWKAQRNLTTLALQGSRTGWLRADESTRAAACNINMANTNTNLIASELHATHLTLLDRPQSPGAPGGFLQVGLGQVGAGGFRAERPKPLLQRRQLQATRHPCAAPCAFDVGDDTEPSPRKALCCWS